MAPTRRTSPFNAAKTNLLTLERRPLIGDDVAATAAVGAGRLRTVPAGSGDLTGGSGWDQCASISDLRARGSCRLDAASHNHRATFNTDATFTAVLTPTRPAGPVTTDSGTWQLSPPNVVQPFGNAQAHLTLTDSQGVVLFSNDILLLRVDTFTSETTGTGSLGAQFQAT